MFTLLLAFIPLPGCRPLHVFFLLDFICWLGSISPMSLITCSLLWSCYVLLGFTPLSGRACVLGSSPCSFLYTCSALCLDRLYPSFSVIAMLLFIPRLVLFSARCCSLPSWISMFCFVSCVALFPAQLYPLDRFHSQLLLRNPCIFHSRIYHLLVGMIWVLCLARGYLLLGCIVCVVWFPTRRCSLLSFISCSSVSVVRPYPSARIYFLARFHLGYYLSFCSALAPGRLYFLLSFLSLLICITSSVLSFVLFYFLAWCYARLGSDCSVPCPMLSLAWLYALSGSDVCCARLYFLARFHLVLGYIPCWRLFPCSALISV